MNVYVVESKSQLDDAFSVRKTVFVDEQMVPMEIEIDDLEDESTHFVLYLESEPIGAGRFRLVDGIGKVERICVVKHQRGTGAGKRIMDAIEEYAKQQAIPSLKLNAQTQAIPFYEGLGYHVVSDEFMDAGIPHKTMTKTL
ncbi:putative GNAT family N-acyltransferase [Bacillus pakistanensis]|uniref:GNAT family N-acyltransferase n=1 Tax=Rossellomorea pakistanensis TaxID=992288 RepID=A0ABS2NFC4_9BACI|nr:putative GNAT family N-acyltransferase [Bacillus pakistanensis]